MMTMVFKVPNITMLIIGAAFSLYLYLSAPVLYSLPFCYTCLGVFLFDMYYLWKYRFRGNLICFEFIFGLCFFYTNFVYSTFYYPISPYFSLFDLEFPEEYINKGAALSALAFSMLTIGLFRFHVLTNVSAKRNNLLKVPSLYKKICVCCIIILLAQLILGIIQGTAFDDAIWEKSNLKVISDIFLYYIIFASFTQYDNVRSFYKANSLFVWLLFIYMIVMLLCGTRGFTLRVALMSLFCYSSYYRIINYKLIFPLLIVGASLMFYIGSVRGEGNGRNLEMEGIPTILNVGQDLVINNRSQYVLMEHADKKGYTYGRTNIMDILSVIPFAQTTFLYISGMSISHISSANLVTDLFFSQSNRESFGLGTNMVGDIYVSFGVVGVILLFWGLGIFISYNYLQGINGNYSAMLIYAMIFINCIVMTRAGFFCFLRPMVWSLIIFKISNNSKI